MISGRTQVIAHLGYPTESFTAPMIYNPTRSLFSRCTPLQMPVHFPGLSA